MTYQNLINAKQAIEQLGKLHFPVGIAYDLFKLKKKIDELFDFEVKQEMSVLEKHHGSIGRDGSVAFDKDEDYQRFEAALKELLNTELSEEIGAVTVPIDTITDVKLAPEQIWQLEGFVTFQ